MCQEIRELEKAGFTCTLFSVLFERDLVSNYQLLLNFLDDYFLYDSVKGEVRYLRGDPSCLLPD
jgi:hypothetical protein